MESQYSSYCLLELYSRSFISMLTTCQAVSSDGKGLQKWNFAVQMQFLVQRNEILNKNEK